MGLFKKKENVLQQDLNQKDNHPGMVLAIHLLMEEKCEIPDKEHINSIMEKHLGEIDFFSNDSDITGIAAKNYMGYYENGTKAVPAMLMISDCFDINKPLMDDVALSQTWDCPDAEQILDSCKYQVIANDMLTAVLDYKQRAELIVRFVEALMELFPTCRAVIFDNSKKMITRDTIINCTIPEESRFIYYAVNVRFFNIQGKEDKMVDTIGMSTLFLPDLQYHFHGMDPNYVVNHAYNFLSYIYDSNNPIKPGDSIDGIKDGQISMDVQWTTRYEESLIQPVREVIDINMGEFAAGTRN